jgi:Sulfotransferase domain
MVQPVRIAMWSGPRNISTAMMRAWGNRADTFVVDEPFYAYYLSATGKKHPVADVVIASGEIDWRKIIARLTGPIPNGKRNFFQKQMAHHLLPDVDREWLGGVTNCFLIRDPREVIASYVKKREDPVLQDLGLMQQVEIFDFVRTRLKATPPVLDAKDVLENPGRILRRLCEAVGVEFSESMLSWPPGMRETDGISFRPYRPSQAKVPAHLEEIYEQCREPYERLYEYRLH